MELEIKTRKVSERPAYLPTDGPTDGRTDLQADGRTYRRTDTVNNRNSFAVKQQRLRNTGFTSVNLPEVSEHHVAVLAEEFALLALERVTYEQRYFLLSL